MNNHQIRNGRVWTAALLALVLSATGACTSTATQKSAGEGIDDAIVLGKVKSALIAESEVKGGSIDVEIFKGVVQLNGFVDTSGEKSRAGTVARSVDGVTEVRNNLSVRGTEERSAGTYVDDATITAKVKAGLLESSKTSGTRVSVDTQAGVVMLSGFVDSAESKAAAETIAKDVTGVKSVTNRISVK